VVLPRRERRGGGTRVRNGPRFGSVSAAGRSRGQRGRLRCGQRVLLAVTGVTLLRHPRLVNASSGDFRAWAGVEGSLGTMPREGSLRAAPGESDARPIMRVVDQIFRPTLLLPPWRG
jgi:hypothetical protein